jgi:hypothetical protein
MCGLPFSEKNDKNQDSVLLVIITDYLQVMF